jgi:AcrR family transcriptional regulator
MDRKGRPVKGGRRYDATRRREQAARRQEEIVAVAEERFFAQGYASTTIADIAEQAAVSVDTIYKTFGGKAGLVHAIVQRALQGDGPIPAEERSNRLQADETDPRKILQGWGRFVAELAPRVVPVIQLIRSAAVSDPDLVSLWTEIDENRLRRMTDNARRLHDAGHLRPGIGIAHAADVLWTYSSPELYELLVLRRKMPIKAYGIFVSDAMIAALLNSTREREKFARR